MKFGSVCSGIEAASVAWRSLGWKAAWLAEIEKFPSAVLAHHYPNTPNLGDMTKIGRLILQGDVVAPDVLVGGTPCQAFSVAGLREGLDDERGQLTLSYVRLFDAIDYVRGRADLEPAICVWENVPGVLSDKTNAFGCLLAGLAGEDVELKPAGEKWSNAGCVFGPRRAVAWRVLDAQYFGVAQRRRRVFVIASARKRFNPAEVLFEFDGLRRDTAPSREAGKSTAIGSARSVALRGREGGATAELGNDCGLTLRASTGGGDKAHVLAFVQNSRSEVRLVGRDGSHVGALAADHGVQQQNYIANGMAVRRLTPVECERLQGFPDNYTSIPTWNGWRKMDASETPDGCRAEGLEVKQNPKTGKWRVKDVDGPRYKALGNSMAVPCMAWIGRRIQGALGHQEKTE
jgi:DNA (cytosine-5)-methyltransferase 1